MERVETLCNLLKEKLENKAGVQELLLTVQMLQSELEHLQKIKPQSEFSANGAAVKIAKAFEIKNETVTGKTENIEPEKTVEVLQIDEADIEAELEEIKKNVSDRNQISLNSKPVITYDPVDDISTLSGRKPSNNEAAEILKKEEIHNLNPVNNFVLQQKSFQKPDASSEDDTPNTPVKDLKKAITPDEKNIYLNELFRGDEAMYERSIKTINGFGIYGEAEYWIRRELKLKLGWEAKNKTVMQFDHLVRRRFD